MTIKEQIRREKVKAVLDPLVTNVAISFGVENALAVAGASTGEPLVRLLIYPAELIRGDIYWIPLVKVRSVASTQDTWIAMVAAPPCEKILFIQPRNYAYSVSDRTVREMARSYVEIADHSPGVFTAQEFALRLATQFDRSQKENIKRVSSHIRKVVE